MHFLQILLFKAMQSLVELINNVAVTCNTKLCCQIMLKNTKNDINFIKSKTHFDYQLAKKAGMFPNE